jgi:DNA replication licensing factor MCM6
LAFDNVRGLAGSIPGNTAGNGDAVESARDGEDVTGRRRGPGPLARMNGPEDVPKVKDATGERLMLTFQEFLEK